MRTTDFLLAREVLILFPVAVLMLLPAAARSQQPARPTVVVRPEPLSDDFTVQVDEALSTRIKSLIAKLGSPLYKQRDDATRGLIEIGVGALPALRKAYHESDELEVRLRIQQIVHTSYFDYHVYNRNGFLGVSMRAYLPGQLRQARLPEGVTGLLVAQVIENTGADRAGMKQNDVIIAIDGKPLDSPLAGVVDYFGQTIRSHSPGTVVAFTVIRGSSELTLNATLGRCPENIARGGRVRGTSELFQKADARFPAWWIKHFHPSAKKTPNPQVTNPRPGTVPHP